MRTAQPMFATLACTLSLAAGVALAETTTPAAGKQADGAICEGFGPQTPRDISETAGTNPVLFPEAPSPDQMNLCNIHLHAPAEHRAPAFSLPADDGAGFRCAISQQLTEAERAPLEGNACQGIAPGDTVEVHWVYSSCDVEPGPGLTSCLSERCANPSLRVETQVYTVVNDDDATDFGKLSTLTTDGGFHQVSALPTGTGEPVEFAGSTTGPAYSESVCSPLQVSWSVRPQCARVSLSSLSRWCADNVFDEQKPHGARPLVTTPALLSPIDQDD